MFSCVYIVLLFLVYVKFMKVRLITAAWSILTHIGLGVLPGMESRTQLFPSWVSFLIGFSFIF